MKRIVLILAALLLIGGGLLFFYTERFVQSATQTVALEAVPSGSSAASDSASSSDSTLLLALSYNGFTLPTNEDETVLIPILPESGIAITCEKGAELTKTESVQTLSGGDYRSVAITVSKGNATRTLLLTETHMAVMYVTANDPALKDKVEPFDDDDKRAAVTALSIGEDGKLLMETGDVNIRLRGNSSREFIKKGYTFTNVDENGSMISRSFLGFPADTKFGLNSLFEDDTKLRDIFSLDICASTLPEDSRDVVLLMKYTELYFNGSYRGLYGLKQILSPTSVKIGADDGLIKMNSSFGADGPATATERSLLIANMDVRQEIPGCSIKTLAITALDKLFTNDTSLPDTVDKQSLLHYTLWVQFLCATSNTSRNVVGIWRADASRFFLTIYDTDLTFGYAWDPAYPPENCIQKGWLAKSDLLVDTDPIGRLIKMDPANMTALAELYFSLRDTALSEETLLGRMNELFNLTVDSGARERDRLRWPTSPVSDTPEEIETFIKKRLSWCDEYFGAYLEGGNQY